MIDPSLLSKRTRKQSAINVKIHTIVYSKHQIIWSWTQIVVLANSCFRLLNRVHFTIWRIWIRQGFSLFINQGKFTNQRVVIATFCFYNKVTNFYFLIFVFLIVEPAKISHFKECKQLKTIQKNSKSAENESGYFAHIFIWNRASNVGVTKNPEAREFFSLSAPFSRQIFDVIQFSLPKLVFLARILKFKGLSTHLWAF